ncbi:MAG: hypothetical protein A2589_00615 [Candidatus Vogelbacteria bacterium RIFOXYD1_FULL_46_19]|uniref:Vitamin K epoxide reductase domain-containing protein n=1 Tax=Candidatus Vogelbacteria bacterium RIFOXYD1_FULL_46_19 TaxID=1802439 RepID=A0A1G2QHW7_9BACT|nr:MAG: hypothetical protein A2589_00615 [Candidatus Vogelbacteria bacterium RIFOXYD1_FULL_46_19]
MPIIFLLVILVVAVVGGVTSGYIKYHRRHGKKLECAITTDCEQLFSSSYEAWRGIDNEKLGLWFFGLVIAFAVLGAVVGVYWWLKVGLLLVTMAGAGYGIYLIHAQIRVIKHWCTWCLVPTVSAVIILLAVLGLLAA